MILKRLFDVFFSLIVLIVTLPFFLLTAIAIKLTSGGRIFFTQKRVGRNNREFLLYKFRTMIADAHHLGSITMGKYDKRITRLGFFLRRTKLDEMPQFLNVLWGDMSIVGPRPEVRKYVNFYTEEEKKILTVKPGLTDLAVLEFNEKESKILGEQFEDGEEIYINNIMRSKLRLSLAYIQKQSFLTDLAIIYKTLIKILL